MPFRLTRHMLGRVCPAASVKTLYVAPVHKGETLGKLNGVLRLVSTPDVAGVTTYTSPFGALEYNLSMLFVPFSVAATYQTDLESQPHVPESVAEWDSLMQKLILTFGSTANSQMYGGSADNADDLDMSKDPTGERGTENTEPAVKPDYPSLGPQGVMRVWNRETFLMSGTKIDAGFSLTSAAATSAYTSNRSISDMVYQAAHDLDMDIGLSGPGYLVLICTRYKPASKLGYAASYGAEGGETGTLAAGDRIRINNALANGDAIRIKEILKDRSTIESQYLRTILFEGDSSVQPLDDTNNPSLSAMWADNNIWRQNDIAIAGKLILEFSTPYTLVPDLMS